VHHSSTESHNSSSHNNKQEIIITTKERALFESILKRCIQNDDLERDVILQFCHFLISSTNQKQSISITTDSSKLDHVKFMIDIYLLDLNLPITMDSIMYDFS
jgi:hypothetical protein